MPAHGVEIIQGIPVTLRNGVMYAYQPGVAVTATTPLIQLGTHDAEAGVTTWLDPAATQQISKWKADYCASMSSRSRKVAEKA